MPARSPFSSTLSSAPQAAPSFSEQPTSEPPASSPPDAVVARLTTLHQQLDEKVEQAVEELLLADTAAMKPIELSRWFTTVEKARKQLDALITRHKTAVDQVRWSATIDDLFAGSRFHSNEPLNNSKADLNSAAPAEPSECATSAECASPLDPWNAIASATKKTSTSRDKSTLQSAIEKLAASSNSPNESRNTRFSHQAEEFIDHSSHDTSLNSTKQPDNRSLDHPDPELAMVLDRVRPPIESNR